MDAEIRRRPLAGWSEPLWGRQEGGSHKTFDGFGAYRDLGPARSGAIVSRELGKGRALIERWSATWDWVERAGARDDEADRNRRERDLIERQEPERGCSWRTHGL